MVWFNIHTVIFFATHRNRNNKKIVIDTNDCLLRNKTFVVLTGVLQIYKTKDHKNGPLCRN